MYPTACFPSIGGMWKNLSFCVVLLVTGVAGAQEYADGHGPGVGIEENLGGGGLQPEFP